MHGFLTCQGKIGILCKKLQSWSVGREVCSQENKMKDRNYNIPPACSYWKLDFMKHKVRLSYVRTEDCSKYCTASSTGHSLL